MTQPLPELLSRAGDLHATLSLHQGLDGWWDAEAIYWPARITARARATDLPAALALALDRLEANPDASHAAWLADCRHLDGQPATGGTDLLTLLGIQPAAKPKPNFTGTIRRL